MKMTRLFFVIAFLIVSIESQENGQQKMEDKFGKCCGLGKSWADEGLRCDKFVGPVSGVSQVEQGLCLEAVNICCVRAYHEKSCDKGKKNARGGLACSESSDKRLTIDDNYQRDCCEGCRLGILTGSMGQGCNVNGFSFGKPWDPAFLECCNEIISPSTVSSGTDAENATTLIPTSNIDQETETDSSTSTSDFDLSLELMADDNTTSEVKNICEILKGLLCSHICVPTEGSYRCECPEGMTLLEDAKTCRTEDSKRCILENPCEHRCNDSGKYVKCECNPGFILSDDNHSCQPITTTTEATTKTITTTKKSTSPPSVKTTQKIQPTTTTRTTLKATTKPVTRSNEETNKIETTQSTGTTKSITKITTKSLDKTSSNVGKTSTTPTTNSPIITKNTQVTRNTPGTTKSMQSGSIPKCPAGYRYESSKSVCDDIDECTNEPCINSKCVNTIGSYVCLNDQLEIKPTVSLPNEKDTELLQGICPPGYRWNHQSRKCIDIDECTELNNDPCSSNSSLCINTHGSFACHQRTKTMACPAGFKFDISTEACQDVNECIEGIHGCLSEVEECRNIEGGYECDIKCRKGFQYNHSLNMCIDIDECLKNICPRAKPICINLPGTFQCEERRKIFRKKKDHLKNIIGNNISVYKKLDGASKRNEEYSISKNISDFTPSTVKSPLCASGFHWNGTNCLDVDECLDGLDNCQEKNQICRNTNGSFICEKIPSCSRGFQLSSDGTCVDIDECVENNHNCSEHHHQYCSNNNGSFDCIIRLPKCDAGFKYSVLSKSCEDIDECSDFTKSPCNSTLSERCINLFGSFTCEQPISVLNVNQKRASCLTGFRYNPQQKECEDVDECAEGIHACGDEICYNQPGGYTCARAPSPITEPPIHREPLPTLGPESPTKCNIGLKYVRNRGCMDINECEESDDACSSNEECINNVGSFTCDCKLGFRRDNLTQACVDINECQFQQNDCLPTQRCDNTLGSYICVRFLSCGTGYTLNAATESCEDDDECILGTHDCSKGYFCRNTLGSYRCDRNSRSQQTSTMRTTTIRTTIPRTTIRMKSQISTFLPSTTTMIPTIQSRFNSCPRGFSLGNSGQCIDIDECQNNPCTQSPFYRCINTIGSYRCMSRVICNSGYKIESETSSRCIDIDECADGSHKCGPDQTCENRQGGYACACPRGFTPGNNNNECLDIDECTRFRNVCGGNGRCKNTKGSFTCVCEAGFEKLDGGNICQDINECENNPQICQHNCVNNWGSYRCVCNPGFRLNNDNRTCSDVDECLEFKENNLCVGFCDNTPGSYSCRCPDGYRLGVDGRTCQDIDECSAGLVCRDPNDMCQNTRGGYKCNKIQCQVGYHRDHERKNRCVRTSRYCPSGDLSCFRSPSHFSYNFITFVSMFPIPQSGQLELFTMRGTHLPGSIVRFSKALVSVRTPPGLPRATESYFVLQQPSPSEAVLCLTRSIAGPQEIELELSMEIYHNTAFAGSAVAKLFIYVTQYEF